jgi:hypothetical protein
MVADGSARPVRHRCHACGSVDRRAPERCGGCGECGAPGAVNPVIDPRAFLICSVN